MKALIVKVKIVNHRSFTKMMPVIVNELETRYYLLRIPEQGKERVPVQSDKEAVDNLLKLLKAAKGPKRVSLIDVIKTDDPDLLNAPSSP